MKAATTWNRAALRIVVPQLGVTEIARRLQTPPTYKSAHGESKMRARGMWYMLSGLEFSRSLIEHIVKLTDFVRDHRVEVKELSKIGSANLSCAFASVDDQSSFCIGSDDLLILGEAGVYISITLYPPNDDNVHEEEIEPSTP